MTSFYDFTLTLLNEQELNFSQFIGHPVLIVNTATQCGFTPQYEALEKLWEKYEPLGLRILAIPSNDFGQQTPGTRGEISQFCKMKYGVTFPQTICYPVKGEHAIALYQWLDQQFRPWARPRWNFYKYLIDRHGKAVAWFPSLLSPCSWWVRRKIEKTLTH